MRRESSRDEREIPPMLRGGRDGADGGGEGEDGGSGGGELISVARLQRGHCAGWLRKDNKQTKVAAHDD